MKINKRLIRKSVLTIAAFGLIGLGVSCTDIWTEQHPGTYYTNNGETVADYLNGRVTYHGDYSYFIAILQKAELWGQMRTYGTYTCFAPNDSAMQAYIEDRRAEAKNDSIRAVFQSLETVLENQKLCDTIARTHLFNAAMFSSDLSGSGVLEAPNFLDRFMSYTTFADTVPVYDTDGSIVKTPDGRDSMTVIMKYLLNQQSVITAKDDTVENGVVHKINKVLRSSNDFLPELMKMNPDISIFTAALFQTGLKDTLRKYYDYNYPEVDYEWTLQAIKDGNSPHHHNTSQEDDYEAIPEKREFKFTVFIVNDSILAADYNIHNLDELRVYAETVYPEGAGLDDTNRNSSLNKLMSYHILPCWLSYQQFNTSQEDLVKKHVDKETFDIEDFFETVMPHSIMRISTAYSGDKAIGIFINRKGTTKNRNLVAPGIKICDGQQGEYKGHNTLCINGEYHYINKMLVYDDFTRNTALQCRMRIMTCTLSPDFINSGGRGRLYKEGKRVVYKYMHGYCTNFEWVDKQTEFYVRYRDANFGTFNGDEMTVMLSYDLAFKLPPVPSDGNYEIRVWNNAISSSSKADRGIVQYYFHEIDPNSDQLSSWRNWDWIPEGIPVDLRINGKDSRIGWVSDSDLGDEAAIAENERAMRNRGYMKAMDSYGGSSPLRGNNDCYRKIVANEYMRANTDYWLRMRQVYSGGTGVNPFSFIEIVPKSIYENNEDRH